MRSSLLAAGLLLLSSTLLTFAQEGEHTERGGRITGTVINAEGEPIDHASICKTVVHPQRLGIGLKIGTQRKKRSF